MWKLKYDTNELIYETETDSQIENKLMVIKGERGSGRDKLAVWDWQMQATAYDKQQVPTV